MKMRRKIFQGNEHNDNHLRKEIKSNHVCVDNELAILLCCYVVPIHLCRAQKGKNSTKGRKKIL